MRRRIWRGNGSRANNALAKKKLTDPQALPVVPILFCVPLRSRFADRPIPLLVVVLRAAGHLVNLKSKMTDRSTDAEFHATKPVIGLTGGIGAGKSAVAEAFGQLGCAIIDSDRLAHEAINEPPNIAQLRRWWGDDILTADGQVDRAAVGRIVFTNDAQLKRLRGLLHPAVLGKRKILVREYERQPEVLAIVLDTPLLLENGVQGECDAIVFVNASDKIRLKRVQTARGWDAAQLRAREKKQLPLDKKREMAQYIVENDGVQSATLIQVRQTLHEILYRFKRLRTSPDA